MRAVVGHFGGGKLPQDAWVVRRISQRRRTDAVQLQQSDPSDRRCSDHQPLRPFLHAIHRLRHHLPWSSERGTLRFFVPLHATYIHKYFCTYTLMYTSTYISNMFPAVFYLDNLWNLPRGTNIHENYNDMRQLFSLNVLFLYALPCAFFDSLIFYGQFTEIHNLHRHNLESFRWIGYSW